jgi:hypothetical protein
MFVSKSIKYNYLSAHRDEMRFHASESEVLHVNTAYKRG